MLVYNAFSAVRDGTFDQFKNYYSGNVDETDKFEGLNLLCMAMTNDDNPEEKLKIVHFLLQAGIDVNFVTKSEHRNALHYFYNCVWRPNPKFAMEITKLLVENGIDVNSVDKYGHVPLFYAVFDNDLDTKENEELYFYLLKAGSDYRLRDPFGKSIIDYARETNERTDFFDIVKEYENGKK